MIINHVAKSKLHKRFQLRQENGRRIPIDLQTKENSKPNNLLDEKHITLKLSNCPDKCFFSYCSHS